MAREGNTLNRPLNTSTRNFISNNSRIDLSRASALVQGSRVSSHLSRIAARMRCIHYNVCTISALQKPRARRCAVGARCETCAQCVRLQPPASKQNIANRLPPHACQNCVPLGRTSLSALVCRFSHVALYTLQFGIIIFRYRARGPPSTRPHSVTTREASACACDGKAQCVRNWAPESYTL